MKTIWIWRLIAVIIILVFAMLMWSLYARLVKLQQQQSSIDSHQSTIVSRPYTLSHWDSFTS